MKLTDDPLWYKDAIIYEAHVKSFFDSTNDGIGDFPGLTSKLDYLQDLGITCLWLLPFFPSPLKDDGYDISDYRDVHPSYGSLEDFKVAGRRGARARHPGADRAGRQPHVRPAPVVPGRAPGAAGLARTGVLRLERHGSEVSRNAHHLHRHREVELDVRRRRRAVLLAPLLLAPARSESQQPGGRLRGHRRDDVLARPRGGRPAAGRGAVPLCARGHHEREPARDACRVEADAARARCAVSRPHAAGGSEPVACRRAPVLRRRRRVPDGVPLSADAAHLHGGAAGGSPPDRRHPAGRRPSSRRRASGHSSSATTTS